MPPSSAIVSNFALPLMIMLRIASSATLLDWSRDWRFSSRDHLHLGRPDLNLSQTMQFSRFLMSLTGQADGCLVPAVADTSQANRRRPGASSVHGGLHVLAWMLYLARHHPPRHTITPYRITSSDKHPGTSSPRFPIDCYRISSVLHLALRHGHQGLVSGTCIANFDVAFLNTNSALAACWDPSSEQLPSLYRSITCLSHSSGYYVVLQSGEATFIMHREVSLQTRIKRFPQA